MCLIVLRFDPAAEHPLLMVANRDEFHHRPTAPLAWWPDAPILGGRDLQAGGTHYEGQWRDGFPNGLGVRETPGVDRIDGTFIAGTPDGAGVRRTFGERSTVQRLSAEVSPGRSTPALRQAE